MKIITNTQNTYFILMYDMRRDLPASIFQSFISDFFEPKPHTVVQGSLQIKQDKTDINVVPDSNRE